MKHRFDPDNTTVTIIVYAVLSALLVVFVEIFLYAYGEYCLGKFDNLLKETETVEILHGTPYTIEYDYSLESAAETELTVFEISTVSVMPVAVETEAITEAITEAVTEVEETEPPAPETEVSAPQIAWTDIDETYAVFIAKTLYGECRACTETEIAAVAWCILNRVDSNERYFPDDVISVITQPYQFLGYREENPIREDLLYMAKDVLMRWYAEKSGEEDVGRVLPKTYCFFTGDGKHNFFTEVWKGTDVWNWSMKSPY